MGSKSQHVRNKRTSAINIPEAKPSPPPLSSPKPPSQAVTAVSASSNTSSIRSAASLTSLRKFALEPGQTSLGASDSRASNASSAETTPASLPATGSPIKLSPPFNLSVDHLRNTSVTSQVQTELAMNSTSGSRPVSLKSARESRAPSFTDDKKPQSLEEKPEKEKKERTWSSWMLWSKTEDAQADSTDSAVNSGGEDATKEVQEVPASSRAPLPRPVASEAALSAKERLQALQASGKLDGQDTNNLSSPQQDDTQSPAASAVSNNSETTPTKSPPDQKRSWAFWSMGGSSTGQIAVEGTDSQNDPREATAATEPKAQSRRDSTNVKTGGKALRPNLVVPSVEECLRQQTTVSRIGSSLRRLGEWMGTNAKNSTQLHEHLYLTGPTRISKVVVVGVHGFFPNKMLRTFIGEPTGTSVKFATEAARSVQRWAENQGISVDIEQIALEGEGKVLHRVEHLYKLLLNWDQHIKKADFVFFASHSQGTPVAVHLLAKLMQDNILQSKAKSALLGMASISIGPMPGLDQKYIMRAYSSIENASLLELFQFQNPLSTMSVKYQESLKYLLEHGTKIIFVGSMNDQLVPLYSSTCVHIVHPNIFRAVYVDGKDVAPEFVSTLLGIALHLKNIGTTDHSVIKEISGALGGTLTGGGHSKIYEEAKVYDMAMKFALLTTSVGTTAPQILPFSVPKPDNNPYLLPWSVHGLLAEASRRHSLKSQLEMLYMEFDNWKPETKPLKDVKYRLSAVSSKL